MHLVRFFPMDGELRSNFSNLIIAIWGLGFIGRAVYEELGSLNGFLDEEYPFPWCSEKEQISSATIIYRAIIKHISIISKTKVPRIVLVWCAGKKGFSATWSDISTEMISFKIVLNLAQKLSHYLDDIQIEFHLVSSAGGLFEGCKCIEKWMPPSPCRPYGYLKLEQEQSLLNTPSIIPYIYRPSSVYGPIRGAERWSLISVLVHHGLLRQVVQVSGTPTTLRDYIYVKDIAKYIMDKIVFGDLDENRGGIHWMVSGKPVAILEVKQLVEQTLRHRIYLALQYNADNSRDITFAPHIYPPTFRSTALHNGISLVYRHWLSL